MELLKGIIGLVFAVLAGVGIFLVGQYIQRFMIEPAVELRKIIGEIGYTLLYYENVLCNPASFDDKSVYPKAANSCRELSARLRAQQNAILHYDRLVAWNVVPSKSGIMDAASQLIGISNADEESDTQVSLTANRIQNIRANLGLVDGKGRLLPAAA